MEIATSCSTHILLSPAYYSDGSGLDGCLSFSRVPLERLGASAHAARSGSCRPEPVRRWAPQGRLREGTASRGRATPAEAPSAAEGEGTMAAPRPFTSFEDSGLMAAASGRPVLFVPPERRIRDSSRMPDTAPSPYPLPPVTLTSPLPQQSGRGTGRSGRGADARGNDRGGYAAT